MALLRQAVLFLALLWPFSPAMAESIEDAAMPMWEKYLLLRDGPDSRGDDWWPIIELEMEITRKKMNVVPVPGGDVPVKRVLAAKSFIAFLNDQGIWVDRGNGVFPLSEMVELPPDIGMFSAAYADGDKIYLGVRKLDTKGPAGILIVDLAKRTTVHIPSFQMQVPGAADGVMEMTSPLITAMTYHGGGFFSGKGRLFAAITGGMVEVDLLKERMKMLLPDKSEAERPWISVIDEDVWWPVINSRGKTSALNQLRKGGGGAIYHPLNDAMIGIHSIAMLGKRLVVATNAGLVEMDIKSRQYVHYPTASSSNRLDISHVSVNGGKLWGSHGASLIRYDLPRRKAVIHSPDDSEKIPAITSFGWFRDRVYIGTVKGIFEVTGFE